MLTEVDIAGLFRVLQLGDAVMERFVHRERDPVKVTGCHFPDGKDDSLAVFHDRQEEEFGNYLSLSPGLTELVLAISSLSKKEK